MGRSCTGERHSRGELSASGSRVVRCGVAGARQGTAAGDVSSAAGEGLKGV